MKQGIVFILLSVLCCWGCDDLPLADNRVRPEPPALPAEVITGDPFVNLTAKKMNVVYVGVPNPLDLQTTGVNLDELTLMAFPPGYITQYEKEYSLNVSTPGVQMVKVLHQGKLLNEFSFRVKRLPGVVASLGNKSSGKMGSGEFRAQSGVITMIQDFDFNVRCQITAFRVARISNLNNRESTINNGGQYEVETDVIIRKAEPDDLYFFTDIKASCDGDRGGRSLNSLVFEII